MDLKIKDVAELLNISETTVRRWLAEGKIPAYRLNRQYRFSRPEIEDWLLRQKLDTAEEEHKTEVGNMQFSLYRALYRGFVLTDVEGSSKEEIIGHTMEEMAQKFDLDAAVLTDLFLDREKMMSTALGHGVAVPHTRDFLLNTHFDVVVTVYPKLPLDFAALDGQSVHTLFFLFASDDRNHLNLLAKVAHLCSHEKSRAFLQSKPGKERLLEFVKHWESGLS
ncbi:MAG: PTS sugar transporter subunit IIA [Chlamydiales bacterium]|nr:PTS sugar transporter subunit IIA [Chlamydiales bacterium]